MVSPGAHDAGPVQCQLHLLRGPAVTVLGHHRPLSRKDAALLAVLAMDGSCARDALAALLWEDKPPAASRASLRQRRFRLARDLGQALVVGDDTLCLADAVAHDLADPGTVLAHNPAALAGELLDGLVYDDCPAFDRWLTVARERWRVARTQALARLASQHEAAHRLAEALACAERLAAEEPLSDHAHRRLMRLHHLRGDLGAAIEVYRRLADRLASELGEQPDDETAALAASLRQGEGPPRAPAPVPAALRRPPRRIGRDAAWQALQAADAAQASVLIEGAPGVGKSRLLGDYVQGLATGSALLVPSRAGDTERPYALLSRLLGRLWFDADALRPGTSADLPAWARRELAALLPELGTAPARLDAARLQRAVATALAGAALSLVALDDVQQADAATLEMLPALQGQGLPRWWMAARSGESPPALNQWLQASAAPRRVSLAALDAAQVQALLDDLALGNCRGLDWAQRLWHHTGGLPLFLLETLRGLHEAGLPDSSSLAQVEVPAGAAQVVQSRWARLPDDAMQLAGVAALMDAPLSLAAAAGLLGGTPMSWAPAFGVLERAHWLDAQGAMHDLVRTALHQALPTAQRRWLHGQIASWLSEQARPATRIARHWDAAGRDDQAAVAFEAAALDARRKARPAEEAALWDQAIAAWGRLGQRDRHFAAWRESIESRLFAQGPAAVHPATTRMLAEADGDGERLDALIAHCEVSLLLGEVDGVRQLANEALTLARRQQDPTGTLFAARCLATALSQDQAPEDALAVLDSVHGLAQASTRRLLQGYLSTRSLALHRASRLRECAAVLDDTLALAVADEDWVEAGTHASNMASLLCSLGRFEEALARAEQALAWRNQLGAAHGVHAGNMDLTHGLALLGLGRMDDAVAAFGRAQAGFVAAGAQGPWVAVADNALATACLMQGRLDAAARHLAPKTGPEAPSWPGYVVARRELLRGRLARLRGVDPAAHWQRARQALGAADVAGSIAVDAESLLDQPAAERLAPLQALHDQALRLDQAAIAARLAWWRVQALCELGDGAAAATLARQQLAAPYQAADLLPADAAAIAERATRLGPLMVAMGGSAAAESRQTGQQGAQPTAR